MKKELNERCPGPLRSNRPDIRFDGESLPIQLVQDPAILKAAQRRSKKAQGPYPSNDGSCALVRILEHGKAEWAGIGYIYLNNATDSTNTIETRVDSIMTAIQSGLPFKHAANMFTSEGFETDGDVSWKKLSKVFPEIRNAVITHHKGDLVKVFVPAKGWFVLLVTEEPGLYEYIQYVLYRGPCCQTTEGLPCD